MLVHPIGLTSALFNNDRRAALLTRFLTKEVRFAALNYFDDNFGVTRERSHGMELLAREWFSPSVLSPREERLVPRGEIITAPMRYVRTSKEAGDVIQLKIRMIGPQIGTYRASEVFQSCFRQCRFVHLWNWFVPSSFAQLIGTGTNIGSWSASAVAGCPLCAWIFSDLSCRRGRSACVVQVASHWR